MFFSGRFVSNVPFEGVDNNHTYQLFSLSDARDSLGFFFPIFLIKV